MRQPFPGTGADIATAVKAATTLTAQAEADFRDSRLDQGEGDVYVLRLLAHRLQLAARRDAPPPLPPRTLTRRQAHDVALLHADIALATGDLAAADRHLAMVEAAPANRVAAAWARLGRAEHADRTGTTGATHADIARDAEHVGAWWLAAQAKLDGEAEATVESAPWPVRARAVGTPRVLWLL